jgi:hypothetical protein
VEELLAEHRIAVDHVTIYRWVQLTIHQCVRRFTPEFIEPTRSCRHAPGDRWFADETYIKIAGQWMYLYRAIHQHGKSSTSCYPGGVTWQRPSGSPESRASLVLPTRRTSDPMGRGL